MLKKYTRKKVKKNKNKTRKKHIEKDVIVQDVWGKRIFIPIMAKIAVENIDNLNRASDYKKSHPYYYWYDREYRRRMLVEMKHSKKSRKIYASKLKIPNNYKKIKQSIGKIPIKRLENIYYELLFKQ